MCSFNNQRDFKNVRINFYVNFLNSSKNYNNSLKMRDICKLYTVKGLNEVEIGVKTTKNSLNQTVNLLNNSTKKGFLNKSEIRRHT